MLGTVVLPLTRHHHVTVFGGPYLQKPTGYVGVKMAQELPLFKNGDHQIDIPTKDFSTPPQDKLLAGLEEAVDQILAGKNVYVGCMGGKGRTGLFLSVLVKAFGIKNPVEYVRSVYYRHAVETPDQYDFVAELKIPFRIRRKIWLARTKAMLFKSRYKSAE